MNCVRANVYGSLNESAAASSGSNCSSSLVSISLRDSLVDENFTNNSMSNESNLRFMRPEQKICSNFILNNYERQTVKSENRKMFNKNKVKQKNFEKLKEVRVNYNGNLNSNRRRNSFKSMESSEISSNNLTCSDLDSNYGRNCSETRIQRKQLIKCVLREDLDLMKNLLCNIDLTTIKDRHQNTLLHIACGFGRLKSVQTLMKLCPKLIEHLDDKGHSPIEVAIKHGQIDVIKWWLSKSKRLIFDIEENYAKNPNQRSLTHFAAKHGENDILKFLLNEMYKQQLSLDLQDSNGNTAAHLAAKYNHLDCLQTLVEFNCDVTIVNRNGHTACFMAEYYGNEECVHYLMIVETCINLSIKVVKLGRKLRESRQNNEALKAQMEEAIAINNDFINQRENVMNISLDLMQRQINELETKIFHHIKTLQSENQNLKEKIEFAQINNNNNRLSSYLSERQVNNLESYHAKCVQLDAHLKEGLVSCKNEILNTKQNCSKVLKMDQKKLESIKSRFDEIKVNLESSKTSEASSKCESNAEIIETKEHLEILRKMYQETTHKLMIFRNALKQRQNSANTEQSNSDNSSHDSLERFQPVGRNKQICLEKNVSKNLDQIVEEEGGELDERRQMWSGSSSSSSRLANRQNMNNRAEYNLGYKSDETLSDENEDANSQLDFDNEDNVSDFADNPLEAHYNHCHQNKKTNTELEINRIDEEDCNEPFIYPAVIENYKYSKKENFNSQDNLKSQNKRSQVYLNRPKNFGNCQVIIEELEEHVEKEIEKIEHIKRETQLEHYYPDVNKMSSSSNDNYFIFAYHNNAQNIKNSEKTVHFENNSNINNQNKIRIKNRRRSNSNGQRNSFDENNS